MAGIKGDGTIWTWGLNQTGQLGNGFGGFGTNRNSPVTVAGGGTTWCQVGTGLCHTSAVKTDGTIWTWGGNSVGQLGDGNTTNRSSPGTTTGGGTDWCFVASSHENAQTLAIKTDGTLWSWGTNAAGQLGDGTTICRSSPVTVAGGGTTWCTVSTTNQHSGAIKTDGTLWTWGANCCNGLGSLGNNSSSPATTTRGGNNWWKVSTTVTGGTLAIERYS